MTTPANHTTPHSAERANVRLLPTADTASWDMPVPLSHTVRPPAFPTDVFPAWMADQVTATAVFTQTDPAMAGTLALAVLSTCAGGRVVIEAKPGWREPCNLFLVVIAEPGERKSPVHSAMAGPLLAVEATLAARIEPIMRENAALKDIAERTAEQAKIVAAKADPAKRDALTADAVAATLAAEAITVPKPPRLLADDATPEALNSLMAANGGRIALISDEGGIFDILAGRYSSTPNLDAYLMGHSGKPIRVDRRGREAEYIANPAVTIGVMAQPSVLRKFGANADLAGRGIVARFLFVLPVSLAGYRDDDAPPIPEHVTHNYTAEIQGLALATADFDRPAVLALTDDARATRSAFSQEIEVQLRRGAELHDMRDWANKLSGTTVRLAALLHLAHYPDDGWRRPVEARQMADAVRLVRFFIDHYRAATNTITADPAGSDAAYALGVLIDKQMTTFTRRELHRRTPRRLSTAAAVTAALDTLTQYGWVRPRGDGRYDLHPRAADLTDAETPQSVDTLTIPADDHVSAAHSTPAAVNGSVDRR